MRTDKEEEQYKEEAELETYVQLNAGHVINLHYSAPDGYARMVEWLDRRFGPKE